MLSSIIKYSGTLSAILAFIGFHYLEIYHGYFGGAHVADAFSTSKQVSRSISFILSSWRICLTILVICGLIALASKKFHFQLFGRTISKLVLFVPLIGVALMVLVGLVRSEAKSQVLLELNPQTTSLRELRCLSSTIKLTNDWFDEVQRQGRKILIARKSVNQIYVFFPPPQLGLGTPYVNIMRIGISDEDILVESRANNQSSSLTDRLSCGR